MKRLRPPEQLLVAERVGGNRIEIRERLLANIVEDFKAANGGEPVDVWPFYRALAGRPVLILRGQKSDLLSDSALARMATEIPDVEIVTVPNVGHAPDLSEPESVAAVDRLLERVLKR